MDDIIKNGFSKLTDLISTQDQSIDVKTEEIKQKDAELLLRMAEKTTPVIKRIGLDMLKAGKIDNKGEIYDSHHYKEKMIVLGKSDEPAPFRPDDMNKKIDDQFIEDPKFILEEDKKYLVKIGVLEVII